MKLMPPKQAARRAVNIIDAMSDLNDDERFMILTLAQQFVLADMTSKGRRPAVALLNHVSMAAVKASQELDGETVPYVDPDTPYYDARREHAARLRKDGMIFRQIAARLGVTPNRASQMVWKYERDLRGKR